MAKKTLEEQVAALTEQMGTQTRIMAEQRDIIDKLKAPKGIKSARVKKKPKKIVFTTEQKAERELRGYIVNAGVITKKGHVQKPHFCKGLSEEKIERARYLMKEILHRTHKGGKCRLEWDESILDFVNHQPPPEPKE